ncbi:aminoacyl-tRNA deacylase [Vibrio porteresiae]|uniref:YbaK/EbsC family protein n=1 Tax=Vibrio porteresiae DSM 19223 TaxID=1123496 RepID=A0ABZ0QBD9_9VIBR|nr:YbaK/EbsC family protein [Vibrio porteresiae]WPC73729.1 YbaK/EbsC family protein [Vibrio porteresiae DSM 19223]
MNNELNTPLIQFLQTQQVSYRLLPHQHPATTIEEAAAQRGISPKQMVKCILLRDMSDRYALACTSGDTQIDPKKVRAVLQWRRMTCVNSINVKEITGYEIGTVTPINLKTEMPILFDNSILNQNEITISSGSRMAGIALKTSDLLTLVNPLINNIQRP